MFCARSIFTCCFRPFSFISQKFRPKPFFFINKMTNLIVPSFFFVLNDQEWMKWKKPYVLLHCYIHLMLCKCYVLMHQKISLLLTKIFKFVLHRLSYAPPMHNAAVPLKKKRKKMARSGINFIFNNFSCKFQIWNRILKKSVMFLDTAITTLVWS